MTTSSMLSILFVLTAVAFLLNLPLGYLRTKTRKFSFMWFFYIHIAIPFIFILRRLAGLGFKVIPIIVIAAVAGQLLGGRMNNARLS